MQRCKMCKQPDVHAMDGAQSFVPAAPCIESMTNAWGYKESTFSRNHTHDKMHLPARKG